MAGTQPMLRYFLSYTMDGDPEWGRGWRNISNGDLITSSVPLKFRGMNAERKRNVFADIFDNLKETVK